jgi:uncharacterized membrane protein YeaQ/YmgE (transglycosylase-associated protein family)
MLRSVDTAVQSEHGIRHPGLMSKSRAFDDGNALALYQSNAQRHGGRRIMFAWILIGLVSGWLAGKILNGNGYGMMADIGLGLLGGVIGGMIFGVLGVSAHNFIGAILMSTAGATALVIATRIIRDEI